MPPELVSIVIVCHNDWPDVELAIQSALHQSYQPVEVIVVDNGSTDMTPLQVPKRFRNSVRYLRQENTGAAGGRNTGLRIAIGEFVQFLDGDDFLAPDKIEKQMHVFQTDPAVDIVYGDVRAFQSFPGVTCREDFESREHSDVLAAILDPEGDRTRFFPHSLLFRRRALELVGPWDETLYREDMDYYLRAAWVGCRFRYCPGALCFWRKRPGQKSGDRLDFQGLEAVWVKALSFITVPPYRRIIASHLARMRFRTAIARKDLTLREALAKLALARATDPTTVNLVAFALGGLLIVLPVPGKALLIEARVLQPLRRRIARLFGVYIRMPVNSRTIS